MAEGELVPVRYRGGTCDGVEGRVWQHFGGHLPRTLQMHDKRGRPTGERYRLDPDAGEPLPVYRLDPA